MTLDTCVCEIGNKHIHSHEKVDKYFLDKKDSFRLLAIAIYTTPDSNDHDDELKAEKSKVQKEKKKFSPNLSVYT